METFNLISAFVDRIGNAVKYVLIGDKRLLMIEENYTVNYN